MKQELEYIWRRRSVRAFTADPVTDDQFKALLEAAMAAPSVCCCDPWEFVVVRERKDLEEMAAALPNGPFLGSCGGAIVVCGSRRKAHTGKLSYMLQDCSAAIQNILLAAPALGLGGCWLGLHPRRERIAAVRKIFNIPESVIPVGACALGTPCGKITPRTRFDAAKLHGGSWDEEVILS